MLKGCIFILSMLFSLINLIGIKPENISMQKINFKSHILPHITAIAVFLIITVIFFSPIFFENKTIRQSDILQGKGAVKTLLDYEEQTGEPALWAPTMFSGMPSYLIVLHFDGDAVLDFFQKVFATGLPRPASIIMKAFISFYILLLVFRVRPYLALAGALAYGLSTFNIISLEAGHNWKVEAMAFMPLVLAGIHATYARSRLWGFTLTALALALEIDSKHPQITYYLLLTVIFYGISALIFAIRNKEFPAFLNSSLVLVAAALLAVGTNLGRLWTTYEYTTYSTRSPSELAATNEAGPGTDANYRDYVFQYSIKKLEALTLLIPNFYGGGSRQDIGMDSNLADILKANNAPRQQIREFTANAPTYFGGKPGTSGPVYIGAVIFFLFVLGIFIVDKKHRYWLIAATVFSIILSWGKYFPSFNYLMFEYFPLYSKFRTVEMALVIAMLCMPLLGFLAVQHWINKAAERPMQKKFLYAYAVVAGLLLLIILLAGLGDYSAQAEANQPGWFRDAIEADRLSMLRTDAFRSLIFITLAASVLYLYAQKKLNLTALMFSLAVLVLLDLWMVNSRYLDEDDYARNPEREMYVATEADEYIINQSEPYQRVLNLLVNPFNESTTSYYHNSIGGYHAAKLRNYQDLVEHQLSEEINTLIQRIQSGSTDFSGLESLNMLNTSYVIAGETRGAVIENPSAYGSAWLISDVEPVASASEAMDALSGSNLKETAVVDTSKYNLDDLQYNAQGSINVEAYEPNQIRYRINAAGKSLAVFSEIYYPVGWTATIDGEPVPILKANYLLRALQVPAGEHTVEFTFRPASYTLGNKVMIGSSIILVLVLLATLGVSLKKKFIVKEKV